MNSDIVNQYMFKINEAKLKQDSKIVNMVKSSFDNYVTTLSRSLQNQMLSECNKINKKTQKPTFDQCVKVNSRKIQNFKEYAKQYTNQFDAQYYSCQDKLKAMAFKPSQRQAFYTIVDLEKSSNDTIEKIRQQARQTKFNRWGK